MTEKFRRAKNWLTSFHEIEHKSKRIWGQLKCPKTYDKGQMSHKANYDVAEEVIKKGKEIVKYCDISSELTRLQSMIEMA